MTEVSTIALSPSLDNIKKNTPFAMLALDEIKRTSVMANELVSLATFGHTTNMQIEYTDEYEKIKDAVGKLANAVF